MIPLPATAEQGRPRRRRAKSVNPAALLRLPDWWHYKLPPLLGVAYLMLAGSPTAAAWAGTPVAPGVAAMALGLFLASAFATAAWGHLVNDLADREADRRAGRSSPLAELRAPARTALLVLFFAAAIVPWLFLPSAPLAWGALAAELLLLAVYSLPPLRLKERGFAGVLADALYGHALPMTITVGLFPALRGASAIAGLLAAALVGWKFAQGLCGALVSQIRDRRADLRAGTLTFVRTRGALGAQRLVRFALLPAQFVLFVAALALLAPRAPFLLPAYALFLALRLFQIHRLHGHGRNFYRIGYPGYALLNDFHERWLPLVALVALVAADRRYLVLVVAHLLLFRNGLGELARGLGRAVARRPERSERSERSERPERSQR
ncbi:MAG: UbiA family prenyltransferase [Thermoanaerobaculia bacterium]